jgi:hypothetical protein
MGERKKDGKTTVSRGKEGVGKLRELACSKLFTHTRTTLKHCTQLNWQSLLFLYTYIQARSTLTRKSSLSKKTEK